MGKINMVAPISLSCHHGVLFKRHFLEMRGEQREVCRRQRREKTITGARRTSHHERLLTSEEHAALLECLWQEYLLRCADTNSTFIVPALNGIHGYDTC